MTIYCLFCVQLLAGADINAKTPHKKNPLHLAAEFDQAQIASILLQEGVDYDAIDDQWNNGKY